MAERFVVETPSSHGPGSESLHEHVRGRAQLAEDANPFGSLEVKGHRATAAVVHTRGGRGAVGPAPRRLDLDDVGAVFGELQHTQRPSNTARQIEYAHAVQSLHGSGAGVGLHEGHSIAPGRLVGFGVTHRAPRRREGVAGPGVATYLGIHPPTVDAGEQVVE